MWCFHRRKQWLYIPGKKILYADFKLSARGRLRSWAAWPQSHRECNQGRLPLTGPPSPNTHSHTLAPLPRGGTRMCSGWWNVCYMLPWICWLIHLSPGLTEEKWIRGCEVSSRRRRATLQTCWEQTSDHFAHSRGMRQSGKDVSDF